MQTMTSYRQIQVGLWSSPVLSSSTGLYEAASASFVTMRLNMIVALHRHIGRNMVLAPAGNEREALFIYISIQHLYVIIRTITYIQINILYHRLIGGIILQWNMVRPFLFSSGSRVVGVGKVLEVSFVSSIIFKRVGQFWKVVRFKWSICRSIVTSHFLLQATSY